MALVVPFGVGEALGCVCLQPIMHILVGLHKDGGQHDELLEFLKGLQLVLGPSPHLSLLGELVQGLGHM